MKKQDDRGKKIIMTTNKTYTREEALKQSTEYFGGDELAANVFVTKYALRNEKLELKESNPEQMHRRLAKEFARIEKKYPNPMSEEEIFGLFDRFRFLAPQGSPMFGIGNPYQKASLSNCFVIDVADSYGGICRADERIAQIAKRRGGVGMNISAIRPKGMPTKNSALTTDGIVAFMDRFSNTTREVAQSGRHGALMLSISVHHPEILNFIKAKRDLKKVTGANISVQVTDEFMEALAKKTTYEQRWPVDSKTPSIKQEVKAKDIWDELVKSNWMSGEPGILFIDSIIKNSPADSYDSMGYRTVGSNPCGELPIPANSKMGVIGSCILLLQNLTSYVKNPFTKDAILDEELLKINTQKSQKLIDDMVDLEIEAISKIIEKIKSDPEDEKTKANELDLWNSVVKTCRESRRTGLGVTGLGDALAMLNITYGSKESLKIIERIFSIIRNESYRSSIKMARERGAFPIWDAKLEKGNLFLHRLPEDIREEMIKVGRRNIACLTVPPAGSISTLTQTSSGFEPVFMAEYTRKRKLMESDKDIPDFIDPLGDKWKNYKVEHHGLKLFKKITGKELKDSPYFGAQAEEINYETRVKMQGIATSYIDHAISSTINLPKDVDTKTIEELYLLAHKEGCKGLTIYRDGSRDGVLTKEASTNGRVCEDCDEAAKGLRELILTGHRPKKIIPSAAPSRDLVMKCEIHRSKVGKGDWLFFVGMLDNQPYEVFGGNSAKFEIPHDKPAWIVKNGKNKAGITQYNLVMCSLTDENEKFQIKDISKHFNNEKYGAMTRLLSLNLRHGVPIRFMCEQLTKTGCAGDFFSFQRAMARILKKYIADGEISGTECPICKSTDVYYKNGCPTCKICGNSNCS